MPLPPPAAPEPPRTTPGLARLHRLQRVARLRRQVVAVALGTFALAFGLVAFDGSMGSTKASATGARATVNGTSQATTDAFGNPLPEDQGSSGDGFGGDGGEQSFDDDGGGQSFDDGGGVPQGGGPPPVATAQS